MTGETGPLHKLESCREAPAGVTVWAEGKNQTQPRGIEPLARSQVERLNLWLPILLALLCSSLTGGATIGVMGGGVADNAADIVKLDVRSETITEKITEVRIAQGQATSERRAINDRLDRITTLLDGLTDHGPAIVSVQAALKTAKGERGAMGAKLGKITQLLERHSRHPRGADDGEN